MKKKQNTDISGVEVTKCPAVKPEDHFQSSRYKNYQTRLRFAIGRKKKFIQAMKQKMVNRLVKEVEEEE